jgi:hypothetical protein
VRDLVHKADPEIQETIKRSVQPYFVLQGNVIALLAVYKDLPAGYICYGSPAAPVRLRHLPSSQIRSQPEAASTPS